MSIALGGQGKLASAKQKFNQAFLCDEPKNNCLLLLIKVLVHAAHALTDESIAYCSLSSFSLPENAMKQRGV